MAFFNQNNFDFVPSAPEEFDSDPFLWRQMLATEERVHRHAAPALADRWTMVDQPGFVTGPSTSVPTTTNYIPSTIGSYPAPSHGSHWPTIDQSAQLDYPSTLSRDNFFQSRQGWGTAVSAPTPNPSKTPASRVQDLDTYSLTVATDSRGSRQYGVPTNVSYTDDTPSHHQPRLGVIRAGMMESWRFTPYVTYRAPSSVYGNTEGGPVTQIAPCVSYNTPSTTQPTRGSPEMMAYAEQTQPIIEEYESTAPRTRRARGKGLVRPHRERNQKNVRKLRAWAKVRGGLRRLPSHKDAIAAATEVISGIRQPVYNGGRLAKGRGLRTKSGSKEADEEYERRNVTRQAYQELSRYYRLEGGWAVWSAPQLLSRALEDLENLGGLPGPTQVPTSTVAAFNV